MIGILPEELSRLITDAVYEALERLPRQAQTSVASKGIPRRLKKLLSPAEISAEFGIKDRLLKQWRMAGIGPTYTNLGRRIFYDPEIFEKFIQAGRIQTTGFVDK
jgi:hypothetical protein